METLASGYHRGISCSPGTWFEPKENSVTEGDVEYDTQVNVITKSYI